MASQLEGLVSRRKSLQEECEKVASFLERHRNNKAQVALCAQVMNGLNRKIDHLDREIISLKPSIK